MRVTVLIATRNRSASLHRTLDSLFCPSNCIVSDWEAVVVDNGSSDSTPELCASFHDRFPERFRFYTEKQKGKSRALNFGIAVARGELLAMTDDDVICAPDYITSIRNVFSCYSADAAQGRVLAECQGDVPEWMSANCCSFIGFSDCGDKVQDPFPRSLFGAGMVVRAAAARTIGGFAPELGAGSSVGFCEDTEFSLRLRHAGYRIIYAPQITVHLPLQAGQLTKRFFRKRYFRLGRSRAYFSPYEAPLWRFGVYVGKHWIQNEAKAAWLRCTGHPGEAIDCQCEARFQAGFFWQHCLFSMNTPRQLTRITSWPNLAPKDRQAVQPLPLANSQSPAEAARG